MFRSDNEFQLGLSLFKSKTIKQLWLCRNSISFLPNNTFTGFRKVTFLSLCKNKLSQFSEEAFKGLDKLLQIDLADNVIKSFPKVLPNCLEDIDLQGNRIKVIKTNDTNYLCNLKKLVLKHNDIETINIGAFEGLENLEVLDLTENQIYFLPGDMFNSLRSQLRTFTSVKIICKK